MSHHLYTTRGIVLSLSPSKEVDKLALILTRDLGVIYGNVRGIRQTNSKMRGVISELALIKVSLVKGKRSWRVTTASLIESTTTALRTEREMLKALYRVGSFLSRLIKGEEKHVEVFDVFEEALLDLVQGRVFRAETEAWELLVVSRLLSHLGYLPLSAVPTNLSEVRPRKKELVAQINTGILESGLR